MDLFRTLLYVPGNNMRNIKKAEKLPVDGIILDLEDSVSVDEKESARIFVKDSISDLSESGSDVYVRINGFSSNFLEDDVKSIVKSDLDGIMLPKSESKEDIKNLVEMLEELEDEKDIQEKINLMPLIETCKGIINLEETANASDRIVAFAFGGEDYTRDLGVDSTKDREELLFARFRVTNVCKAYGIPSIDTPWTDIVDKDGLVQDSEKAKQMGFVGKQLIHPDHIEPVNKVFSPSEEEIENAKKVVEAFEKAQEEGKGVASLEGNMIDNAHYQQALRTLKFGGLIKEKSSS